MQYKKIKKAIFVELRKLPGVWGGKVSLTQHFGVKSKQEDVPVVERYRCVCLTTCPASNDASDAKYDAACSRKTRTLKLPLT